MHIFVRIGLIMLFVKMIASRKNKSVYVKLKSNPEKKSTGNTSNKSQQIPAVDLQIEETVVITRLNKQEERIEIKNLTDKPIDISGWSILSVTGGQVFTFPDILIQPNSVISVGDRGKNPDISLHWLKGRGIWNNAKSDPAELYNEKGELIDRYHD
ncbi:hypothetical protein AN639_04130 [Candidatus Epulonipiscium fishelsonii]|uniref:Uncharacterized protein n=1 Tax=Candidatus Epulonipiscium fishelsonii TaxID=77094 RepID=A0ACC8XGQ6_9FIRM|nr:hypothetical protein AN639_04130 [Epulopiscium sp. SCG-B05WGA-EpuloA1]ONI42848.1 hypothetical protein AN396_13010 [Epulopiscium sp. SCG-B11WGA-EpuloA1]ONI47592.1 hypothetical protein AN644_04670 [Epulopiscium sp. SCG-C06WGA-EpuloA1]